MTAAPARATHPEDWITEVEWQKQVTDLLKVLGWRWMHVRKSKGYGDAWTTATNVEGWPDLLCWSIRGRPGFLAIELKVRKNPATPNQLAVLDQLHRAGAKAWVLYPRHLDALAGWLTNIEQAPTRIGW